MSEASFGHWSRYWALGNITSLPEDFTGNYDGEVAAFWRRVFEGVPPKGRVLDVCTGNGAIAMLAAEALPEASVTALDAAESRPDRLDRKHADPGGCLERIDFVSGVRVEDYQAPPASFDLVTSHYGIEYADWGRAAKNLAPLIRSGGRLAVLAHSPDSDMVAVMEAEAREYAQLYEAGLAKLDPCQLPAETDRFRNELSQLTRRLHHATAGSSETRLLDSVVAALETLGRMPNETLAAQQGALEQYLGELKAGDLRLRDMLGVNQALLRSPDWHRVFQDEGLELMESGTIHYAGRHACGQAFVYRNQ